jgi:hypothetical protein
VVVFVFALQKPFTAENAESAEMKEYVFSAQDKKNSAAPALSAVQMPFCNGHIH